MKSFLPSCLLRPFAAGTLFLFTAVLGVTLPARGDGPANASAPNIIFIATDDLCDWVGPLDSPIRAKTPNMDRLAARGVTFMNAQASGSFCAPARTALFTGRHPSTTGAYTTQVYPHDHPELRPLQVALQQGGYQTYGTGKLFHHPAGYVDLRGWDEFHVRTQVQRETGWPVDSWKHGAPLPTPMPYSQFTRTMRTIGDSSFMEYAPLPNETEKDMADTQQTEWAIDVLKRQHDKPFFIALGLYCPHFPNYAPQKYYDLYSLDDIKLPPIKDDDSDDLPPAVKKFYDHRKATIQDPLVKMGIMKDVLRAYLACTTYADANLGRVLDALDKSPACSNTVVIFWSDQGYHHGEKGQWGKHTLWARTAHIPFIWAGPGIAKQAKVDATVSAIDLFPTLVDLCHLKPDAGLEGQSLATTLRDPSQAKDRNVLMCEIVRGGYTIANDKWRYIHYAAGGEELYNEVEDPNEWNNLAFDPANYQKYTPIMEELRRSAPKQFAPAGPEVKDLKLVTEGEQFHWELKPANAKKKKNTDDDSPN